MEMDLIIPERYEPLLNLRETEKAIQLIKEFFQVNLAFELNLVRVTAPLFVKAGTGINDDLNGVERPIAFKVKGLNGTGAEIVHSLAKWKRMMLADYGFGHGEGLYTDMNAIRADEILDNLHSVYVDQWDWEKVITPAERNLEYLKGVIRKIYDTVRRTEEYVAYHYSAVKPILPREITFVHSEDLEHRYPYLNPREREKAICKEHGAVFIIGIGGALGDGKPHDGRAPDYDDWSTPTNGIYKGLNGDILLYNPILDCAFELSSMGIRVDVNAPMKQLEIAGQIGRKNFLFQKRLINNELPLSIGGGIGQSRLCMFYLRKAHVGEIQAGIWPDEMIEKCKSNNIGLL